jgi:hypothetical protein
MSELRRPRLWIALALGVAVGVLMYVALPPQFEPKFTFQLPQEKFEPRFGGTTSDGRFAFTQGNDRLRVWNLEQPVAGPVIEHDGGHNWLLSPDEQTLVCQDIVPTGAGMGKPVVTVYDLKTTRREVLAKPSMYIFFAPDGRLLGIDNGVVTELRTGKVVRRLGERDGFPYRESVNEYAVFEKAHPDRPGAVIIRVYSIVTDELWFEISGFVGDASPRVYWVYPDKTAYMASYSVVRENYLRIFDAASGAASDNLDERSEAGAAPTPSPDGRHVAWPRSSRPWFDRLEKWLPALGSRPSWQITDWRSGEVVGTIPGHGQLVFAPDVRSFTILREDNVIAVYDFPSCPRPWFWIIAPAVGAMIVTWGVAFGCSRYCSRTMQRSVPTSPHDNKILA